MRRLAWIAIPLVLCVVRPVLALTQGSAPAIYSNILIQDGQPVVTVPGGILRLDPEQSAPDYTVKMLRGNPAGTDTGFVFSFIDPLATESLAGGSVFYSLWDPMESRYPMPHYRFDTPIDAQGRARIDMSNLTGRFDLSGWEASGEGILYYRVANAVGAIVYEGKFFFTARPFTVGASISTGPWVAKVTHDSATVAFETDRPILAQIIADGRTFSDTVPATRHEIALGGLPAASHIGYTVRAGGHEESYGFTTAPRPGTRSNFVFAYSTDSRESIASGERSMAGVNAYMMRRVMALSAAKDAAFLQFTGDTMSGYDANVPMQLVKYANFQRAILPWASRIPVYTGMGNHETIEFSWDNDTKYGLNCDRFPFATDSAEAVFADVFVNPENGPSSEDGAFYDPNPATAGDFPTYRENVYAYRWDNVAMIVLNSQYLYSPSLPSDTTVGGNLWGYLLDNQLTWLESTLADLQDDPNIDHIFVTQHTPVFPNGGHVNGFNSMWQKGENLTPIFKGTPPARFLEQGKGSMDRRDQYLRILLSHSKVKAILAGDEHNYSRLLIRPGMPVYDKRKYLPDDPLKITRDLWHITVGSAGAPYYYHESAPWNRGYPGDTQYLKAFSTQHAVAFFHVHGPSLKLEMVNPDTLERIE